MSTRIATISLSKPVWPNLNAQQKQIAESQFKSLSEKGGTIGVMPVVDRGELFCQDGQRVYAVSLESGMPLPGWGRLTVRTAPIRCKMSGAPRAAASLR